MSLNVPCNLYAVLHIQTILCDCTSYISFPGNLLAIHSWDEIRNHFENLLLELVVSGVLEHVYIDPLIAKSLINDQEFSVMQKW